MLRRMIVVILVGGPAMVAQALEVGVKAVDITPDVAQYKVPMAGYGAREGKPSTGVHDALFAKVLYLREGDQSMALVTCDLRSITPALKAGVVAAAADTGLNLETLMMCASHSHSGPSLYPEPFWQFQFGVSDSAMVAEMAQRIGAALTAAAQALVPVEVGYGETPLKEFAKNRRWGYDTEAREEAGEVPAIDGVLRVVRFDGAGGDPVALFVNYTAHPTILGADNFLLSGEWPGVLQRHLEVRFPGATVLFGNGALGDQSPGGAEGADNFARIEDYGSRLAAAAVGVTAAIETRPATRIGIRQITPTLPDFDFSDGAKNGPYKDLMGAALTALPQTLTLQILAIDDIALVGLPGEPIAEVGGAVARSVAAAGFAHPVILGLANDYIGYIVNEKEYAHGGYEVDMRSYYGPGLGEFVVTATGELAAMFGD